MSLTIAHTYIHCFKCETGTPHWVPRHHELFYTAAVVPNPNPSRRVHSAHSQNQVLLTKAPRRLQHTLPLLRTSHKRQEEISPALSWNSWGCCSVFCLPLYVSPLDKIDLMSFLPAPFWDKVCSTSNKTPVSIKSEGIIPPSPWTYPCVIRLSLVDRQKSGSQTRLGPVHQRRVKSQDRAIKDISLELIVLYRKSLFFLSFPQYWYRFEDNVFQS